MVDGKPLAGTVSMLASKFSNMSGASKETAVPNSSLQQAIQNLVERTREFNNSKLADLAMLLDEALVAKHLDEFNSIGERMQLLNKEIDQSLSNEASALVETIPAFTWKLVAEQNQNPAEFIEGCRESTQYYLNRILQANKQLGKTTEWPNTVYAVYTALLETAGGAKEMATDMKPAAKTESALPKGKAEVPAQVALQGNKWIVEKGSNCSDPVVITPDSMRQGVIIENCENLRVLIQGKVTAVSVNRCKRLFLEVQDIVSNVEAMATQRSDISLLGCVPTVVLDDCEGVKLLLNEKSRFTQVLSSKCAELNLVISKEHLGQGSDETVEIAIPFQFKSVLNSDGSVITEAVKHAGA